MDHSLPMCTTCQKHKFALFDTKTISTVIFTLYKYSPLQLRHFVKKWANPPLIPGHSGQNGVTPACTENVNLHKQCPIASSILGFGQSLGILQIAHINAF